MTDGVGRVVYEKCGDGGEGNAGVSVVKRGLVGQVEIHRPVAPCLARIMRRLPCGRNTVTWR